MTVARQTDINVEAIAIIPIRANYLESKPRTISNHFPLARTHSAQRHPGSVGRGVRFKPFLVQDLARPHRQHFISSHFARHRTRSHRFRQAHAAKGIFPAIDPVKRRGATIAAIAKIVLPAHLRVENPHIDPVAHVFWHAEKDCLAVVNIPFPRRRVQAVDHQQPVFRCR